jgi:hypothetical protein
MIDKFKKGRHVYTHWDKNSKQVTVLPKTKKETGQTINIEVPQELVNGTRANVFVISHSNDEFVFDFAFLPPNQNNARITQRVITSAKQAKKILLTLEKNMKTND